MPNRKRQFQKADYVRLVKSGQFAGRCSFAEIKAILADTGNTAEKLLHDICVGEATDKLFEGATCPHCGKGVVRAYCRYQGKESVTKYMKCPHCHKTGKTSTAR